MHLDPPSFDLFAAVEPETVLGPGMDTNAVDEGDIDARRRRHREAVEGARIGDDRGGCCRRCTIRFWVSYGSGRHEGGVAPARDAEAKVHRRAYIDKGCV